MKVLIAFVLIAILGWSGYWFAGQLALREAYSAWFEARRAEGWQAETSALDVQGFPNRLDVGLSDLVLADPETGLAWEAPFFEVLSLSYRPNHVIAVWPDDQLIATPEQKFRIASEDMRASLVFAPGADLLLERSTLTAAFLRIMPENHANDTTALSALTLATERVEEMSYRFGISAEGLTLSPPWRARLDPETRLPDQLSGLNLDLIVTFDKPWDRTAIEAARPQPTYVKLALADARWGQLHLQAAGAVKISAEGFPDGEVTLKARNWREILSLGVASGAVPEALAGTIESGLTLMAQMAGNPETLDIPLTFRGGRTRLGPIPLGPAPILRLR